VEDEDLVLEFQAVEEDEAIFEADDLSSEQLDNPEEATAPEFEDEDEQAETAKDKEPKAE
jgi:hypothetical protein